MTKSELIENIVAEHPNITKKHIEFIINSVFASIKESLQKGEKVEIRGFGSFKIRNDASFPTAVYLFILLYLFTSFDKELSLFL